MYSVPILGLDCGELSSLASFFRWCFSCASFVMALIKLRLSVFLLACHSPLWIYKLARGTGKSVHPTFAHNEPNRSSPFEIHRNSLNRIIPTLPCPTSCINGRKRNTSPSSSRSATPLPFVGTVILAPIPATLMACGPTTYLQKFINC